MKGVSYVQKEQKREKDSFIAQFRKSRVKLFCRGGVAERSCIYTDRSDLQKRRSYHDILYGMRGFLYGFLQLGEGCRAGRCRLYRASRNISPLANLIFLAISFFTPDAYNNTDFSQRYSWTEYPAAIAVAVIWCVICLATFVVIFTFAQKKLSVAKRVLVSLLMFFSVPILYLLERGNIIILTLFALALYAFTYNSKSKIKRELGLIALAFAFAIKLYPVVFGWFLIADKRFKEAIRCAIYGVALLVIPSFFFGGFSCFHQIFLNIFSFSSGTGNVLSIMLEYIGMPPLGQSIMTALVYAWVFICGICFAISPFIRKDQPYKTWSLGLVTILCVPSLTSIYSWAFMLIPLIMLFCRSEITKKDMTYSVMMTVPFVFLPFRFSHHVSGNTVLVYVATAVFSVWCVVDMIKDTVNYIKARKA